AREKRIRLLDGCTVDVHLPANDPHAVPWHTNYSFDEVWIPFVWQWRAEHHYVLPLRIAPQRHVHVGEGNARVVSDPAYDQVIADQYRIFHRAAWDHARLHQRSFDQQERHNHPEPRNHFAPDAVLRLVLPLRLLYRHCFRLSCHDEPPPRVAPAQSDSCRCSTTYRIFLLCILPRVAAIPAKDIRVNPRSGTGVFLPRCEPTQSARRAAACPRRNNTAKSSAGN